MPTKRKDETDSDEEYIDNDRNVPEKIPKKRKQPKKAKKKDVQPTAKIVFEKGTFAVRFD